MKLSQKQSFLRKTRSKTSFCSLQTDVESSYSQPFYHREKKTKKKKIIKKRTGIQKKINSKVMFHQIYRFNLPRAKKTLRVYCYLQKDMDWQSRFTNKLCQTTIDNDQDSDQDIVEQEIENGRLRLLEGINQSKKHAQNEKGK